MTTSTETHGPGAAAAPRSASSSASAKLLDLLGDRASAKEIERHLDALAPAARLEQVLAVTGKWVKRLYDAVADAETFGVEEIIPEGHDGTAILEGRNSLPLFTRFQKRFHRLSSGLVVGYNHQKMSFVTGPGYFVIKPPSGEGPHPNELLFDYTEAPPSAPAGWPAYAPNHRGLSRGVYMNLKDYVRRVARGVVVGKAYKLGVDQKAYFSLTRA